MPSNQKALAAAKAAIPDGKIQAQIEYEGLIIFQIFTDDPHEGQMDPFYSYDPKTGEFRDFSVLTDGNTSEIMDLFVQAKKK